MPTFTYDGHEIPFEQGESIIAAAARAGHEIPHYCWHPGLSAPANCRMCLVEILPKAGTRAVMLDIVELDQSTGKYCNIQKPKLQPACQMSAAEGIEVKGDSSEHVVEARKGVQEFLLLNHPVDCPICDQSGECKLQDYWLDHGQFQKRMRDEPVHKPKAVSFGPTIVYDAERCVMCTRCIRFMDEVAKDPVLEMRERGNLNEVMVAPGKQLEGHYTFMTEHVCPVGALTTKDFRFKARVWFLRSAKSVCQGCATGCNTHLDFDPRFNRAYRYRPRDNMAVNKYWMCDDGMLTYKRAQDGRIIEPRVEGGVTTLPKALATVAALLSGVPKESVAFVLSAQHSLEDNWVLRQIAMIQFGSNSFYFTAAPDGYADNILLHKDKNSNTRGVRDLVSDAKPLGSLQADIRAGRVKHVIALGGDTPNGAKDAAELQGAKIIVVAAHESALTQAASVVLPATSWAEQSGIYVNAKGMQQKAEKALEPQGESKPAWQHLADVARALGFEPSWSKLKHIRVSLEADTPSTANATDVAMPAAIARGV